MGGGFCSYDCQGLPTVLSPYPDISGIGVSLSYTITAGLALLIVFVYYITVYRPDTASVSDLRKDAEKKQQTPHLKINPIDVQFLGWRLKTPHLEFPDEPNESRRMDCMGNALVHCMLIISDFQLVTGLSVMISGFTQLRCGISIYHWHKIIQLAWFSSITHFCCLTFLRDYFHHNKLAQFWRIPGMVILVISLTIALIPTAQYTWYFDDRMTRSEVLAFVSKPAICGFPPHRDLATSNSASIQRAGISITLLITGMVVRLCHLYEAPTYVYLKLRMWCSDCFKFLLRKVHNHCRLDSKCPVVVAVFLYRPLLTIFLCYRVLLDVVSSKGFEVWWLAISFFWGALNLWHQRFNLEPESGDWTFGQVFALTVLVAPVVALIDGYMMEASPTGHLPPTHVHDQDVSIPALPPHVASYLDPATRNQPNGYLELSPDHNFYDTFGFTALVYSTLLTIAQVCAFTPLDAFVVYTPYTVSMSFAVCLLLSLVLSKFEPVTKKKRFVVKLVCFVAYAAMLQAGIITGFMAMLFGYDLWLRLGYLAAYVGLSCLHAWRMKRSVVDNTDGIWRDE